MVAAGRAVLNRVAAPRGWFLVCLGLAPVLVFTLISAWSRNAVLFHWAAPGYLLWIPLLAAALTGESGVELISPTTLRRFSIASAALVAGLVFAVSLLAQLPWPNFGSNHPELAYPLQDLVTWREVPQALKARGYMGAANIVVGATSWHDAGKLDYALDGAMIVTCLSPDARQYGIQAPLASFVGRDMIIVTPSSRVDDMIKEYGPRFASIVRQDDVQIHHFGQPIVDLAVLYGTGLKP